MKIGVLKPKRFKSALYLDFIRALPCMFCHSPPPSDPHHVTTRGAGGSDLTAVPVCRKHHIEVGQIGKWEMEKRYGVTWDRCQFSLLQEFIESGGSF